MLGGVEISLMRVEYREDSQFANRCILSKQIKQNERETKRVQFQRKQKDRLRSVQRMVSRMAKETRCKAQRKRSEEISPK